MMRNPAMVTGQGRGQYGGGDGRERKGLLGSGVLGGARAEPHSHTGAPGSRENSCPHFPRPCPLPSLAWASAVRSDSVS